ncbi:hypothetical protein [Parapedobacter defluvii]|uniref:hypothetical protein n=1 Tax=Parapedobacter defluvii TaxID=2045106 RepID=UPI00166A0F31|nr:hypothetical protein [Parapedobacter defluvii]
MACSLGISMQVGIAARHHNHRRSDSAGTSEAMSVGVPQAANARGQLLLISPRTIPM